MKISHATVSYCLLGLLVIPFGSVWIHSSAAIAQSEGSNEKSQEASQPEYSDEEKKQILAAERFMSVLLKSPRRGTALDRVYGHHVEFGTLDTFLDGLRQSVQKNPKDGASWMLIGLFESQRGADTQAVAAFQESEKHRPSDPLAPYYLAQSLMRLGESQQAVEAMERAISLKPPRADLMEIFQQLGRVHQRAQRTDEALKVWKRMEEMFPDDERVLEQIASILNEEGQFDIAMPRYEKLAKISRDEYRRTTYRMAIAELKVKTSKREEGIKTFEDILGDLNPDSWIYKDVRRRIEEVFLRSGDQDSLVKYYDTWLTKHPDDVDSMVRLAKYLSSVARMSEANQRMEKALQLAPSRSDLRRSYIDQLVDDDKLDSALEQFKILCEQSPNNSDYLRDWGKFALRNKSWTPEKRDSEVTRIWDSMLKGHEKDALVHTQVADLFRNANLASRAMELYKKAVELAPSEPQYREYLGEYLHMQKKIDEAKQTWAEIASGSRRNAENLARLSEVYNSFGYSEDAVREINDACKLAPKEFAIHLKGADFNARANQYDQALEWLGKAEALAANDEERESVIAQRIEVLQTSQRLEAETDRLAASIAEGKPTVEEWHLLARYREAARQYAEARSAIESGMKLSPQSIPLLTAAARVAEASGDFAGAATWNRQLAKIDRRSRDDYLRNVARLETELGRPKEAMAAANELILAAPGNTENYEFLSQLCFKLGKAEEGVDALRKAVRINPNEPNLMIALANALAGRFQTREAIELYWRAFDKSDEVEDKTSMIAKLVPLYEEIGQTEQLFERLERERKEEDKRRTFTICLAQAHQTNDDLYSARQELESLLSDSTRDTNLLQQLAKLCQSSSDWEAAIGYQRQLVNIAPGHETELPLAAMLNAVGEKEEASEIIVRITRREQDPVRLLKSLDSLLAQERHEQVIDIIEPIVSQQRDNWELLYREGIAWFGMDKVEEATVRFQRILDLGIPHEKMGAKAEADLKAAQQKAKADAVRANLARTMSPPTPLQALFNAEEIRRATGFSSESYYYSGQQQQTIWTPDTYAEARMGVFSWLLRIAQDKDRVVTNTNEESVDLVTAYYDRITSEALKPNATIDTLRDGLFAAELMNDQPMKFKIARGLPKLGGREEKLFYLGTLTKREFTPDPQGGGNRGVAKKAKRTPLSQEDLELAIQCYESNLKPTLDSEEQGVFGGTIHYASNGQMYVLVGNSYRLLSGVPDSRIYTQTILEELRFAGREKEADALLAKMLEKRDTPESIVTAMQLLLLENRLDELPKLFSQWKEKVEQDIAQKPLGANSQSPSDLAFVSNAGDVMRQWMGRLSSNEDVPQISKILDVAIDIKLKEMDWERKYEASNPKKTNRRNRMSAMRARETTVYGMVYYGTEQKGTNVECPIALDYLSQEMIEILLQARDGFVRGNSEEELVESLKRRMEKASGTDRNQLTLWLATIKHWRNETEESLELVTEALMGMPKDLSSQLQLAQIYMLQQDFEKALSVVDQFPVKDQKEVQQREMIALRLSERIGNTARAQVAAERMFGWKLDTESQKQLVESMRRLGMQSYANAINARLERSAVSKDRGSANLMALYYGQGKIEQAKQIAFQILRRTTVSRSRSSASSPFSNSNNEGRSQALGLLQQTGELKKLIEQAEEQVARSPKSMKSYDLLFDYYQAANQPEKSMEIVKKVLEINPKLTELRLKLAQSLERAGENEKACDEYVIVIKEQPRLITNELQRIQSLFQSTQRINQLVNAMDSIDMRDLGHPYYVLNIIATVLREDDQSEDVLRLFEKVYDRFPSYRPYLFSNLRSEKLLRIDRVFAVAKRALVPSIKQRNVPAWYGLTHIQSYSQEGKADSVVHTLLKAVEGSPKAKELETAIDAAILAHPKWYAGKALAALVRMKSERREEGIQLLRELLQNDQAIETMPSAACWLVGQEIDEIDDLKEAALALYERFEREEQMQSQQAQYSPITRLVKLYQRTGDNEKAKSLLIKITQKSNTSRYDRDYDDYMRLENTFWAADKLLAIGFGLDALRVANDAMRDKKALQSAAQWGGNRSDMYAARFSEITKQALQKIDGQVDPSLLEGLLTINNSKDPTVPRLDLLVSDGYDDQVYNGRRRTPQSELIRLLAKLCQSPNLSPAVDARFRKLHEQYPNDLSITIGWFLLRDRVDRDRSDEVLQIISKQYDAQPLESIPAGRRASTLQRKQAAQFVPLSLVAERLLEDRNQFEIAAKWFNVSLEAAFRQMDQQSAIAIGMRWADHLAKGERKADLENHLNKMLERVTVRPELAAANSGNQETALVEAEPQDSTPEIGLQASVAPLTIQQFEAAIKISVLAARSQLAELSRKALEESLRTGLPIDDLTEGSDDPFSSSNSISMGGLFSRAPSNQAFAEEVSATPEYLASKVEEVLVHWKGEQFSAGAAADILLKLYFPESRPQDIDWFQTSSSSLQEKVHFATTAIQWCSKADRLNDMLQEIEKRQSVPQSKLHGLVLRGMIALHQKKLDETKAILNEVDALIRSETRPESTQSVVDLCTIGMKEEGLVAASVEVLYNVCNEMMIQTNGESFEPMLVRQMIAELVKQGETDRVNAFIEASLVGKRAEASQHGGDYGNYTLQQALSSVAETYASLQMHKECLDYYGRSKDLDLKDYPESDSMLSLTLLVQHGRTLSPEERYQFWADWTLPNKNRRTLRFAFGQPAASKVPPFLTTNKSLSPTTESMVGSGMVCNWIEMLEAAKESKRLEGLIPIAQQCLNDKVPNAAVFRAMVLVYNANDRDSKSAAEAAMLECFAKCSEDLPENWRGKRPTFEPELTLFMKGLEADTLTPANRYDWFTRFDRLLRARGQTSKLDSLQNAFALDAIRRSNLSKQALQGAPVPSTNLKHWAFANGRRNASQRLVSDPSGSLWLSDGNAITRLSGPASELAYFRIPLTGDFEFTVDAYNGFWGEADAGYNGVTVESQQAGPMTYVRTVEQEELLERPDGPERERPGFGSIRVVSEKGMFQYWLNNYLVYEEKIAGNFPWITLCTDAHRINRFQNFKVRGNPVIPRSVPLVVGDRLDGWAGFSKPHPRTMAEDVSGLHEYHQTRQLQQQADSEVFNWIAKEGELQGANLLPMHERSLVYQRPMQPGDSIQYEFYYDPNLFSVFPSVGPVAFSVGDSEVSAVFLSKDMRDDQLLQARGDSRKQSIDGAIAPTLKPQDWNQAKLSWTNNLLVLQVNGATCCSFPADDFESTHFGFYFPEDVRVRVRNITLSGDWPADWSAFGDNRIAEATRPLAPDDRLLLGTIVPRDIDLLDAGDVVRRSRKLSEPESLALLEAWVLPDESSQRFRMGMDFLSRDEQAANTTLSALSPILAPAVELVQIVHKMGKSDEYLKKWSERQIENPVDVRSRDVLLAMLAVQSNAKDAKSKIAAISDRAPKVLPKWMDTADRLPELNLAILAGMHPEHWKQALDLVQRLREVTRNKETAHGEGRWQRLLSTVIQGIEGSQLRLPKEASWSSTDATGPRKQWTSVSLADPQTIARGYVDSPWIFERGSARQIPGAVPSRLLFQSPLAGTYEIQARLSTWGYHEVQVGVGMFSALPKHDLKSVQLSRLGRAVEEKGSTLSIPHWDTLSDFQISVVDNKRIVTRVNGVQIYEYSQPSKMDPWISIQSLSPYSHTYVRDLRIVGTPSIPSEIDMLAQVDLLAWRNYFGESLSEIDDMADERTSKLYYEISNQELTGRLRKNVAGRNVEALLQYVRPMLEDGEIEFESFFEPGKIEVFPAVGDVALLSRPQGLSLHTVTRAQWEDRGLSSDNETILTQSSNSPWKVKDWNHIRLKLAGDTLTLYVNSTEVGQATLTIPAHARYFGLFRYSDKTEMRVRKMKYRGDWPKTLPTVEEQDLAIPTDSVVALSEKEIGSSRKLDLRQADTEGAKAGLTYLGKKDWIRQGPNGLELSLQDGSSWDVWPGIKVPIGHSSDIETRLSFEGLKCEGKPSGWGAVLCMQFEMEDADHTVVEVSTGIKTGGESISRANLRRSFPNREHATLEQAAISYGIESGEFRMVRRGGQVHCFVWIEESKTLRWLHTMVVGDAPIKSVSIQSKASDNESKVSVVLKELSIRNGK